MSKASFSFIDLQTVKRVKDKKIPLQSLQVHNFSLEDIFLSAAIGGKKKDGKKICVSQSTNQVFNEV